MVTQLERRTETRQAILDATLTLFVELEGSEPSLDAVAERAGVAKSTVLYHFQSRLGLLDALAERLSHEMGARLGPLEQHEDAAAFVRAFLRDGRSPSVRVFHQVSDHLQHARGLGRGLYQLSDALQMLGVTDRPLVVAAAAMTMARHVAFGQVDDATLEAFVDDLFALGG